MTECNQTTFEFAKSGRRRVNARFDGGYVSTIAGVMLLAMADAATGISTQLASCFTDNRDPDRVEHSLPQLLKQRIFALVLGYEDLNDHDRLRLDPLLAVAVGEADVLGEQRRRAGDRGAALAGKSTLNRLELAPDGTNRSDRYHKIVADGAAIENLLVELFIQAHDAPPDQIILDLDATDVTLHGNQPERFYHGYYGDYCYLPLYIHYGEHILVAKLRPSNIDASAGALDEVKRVIQHIRGAWPKTRIILRGDSGFCRDEIMSYCDNNAVTYLFGMAKNARLKRMIGKEMNDAYNACEESGEAARRFSYVEYRTVKSWSASRRVVAKAEHLPGMKRDKANPRFVVTNLSADEVGASELYENWYCARGEQENRIKEVQLDLFGDRLSTTEFRSNQLRIWLTAIAYTLARALIRLALHGTKWASIQTHTLREKLYKIGARIEVTVRRIWIHMSSSFPDQSMFERMYTRLQMLKT